MQEKDLIEKLQTLQNIKPTDEQVNSARAKMVQMIESEEPTTYNLKPITSGSRFESLLAKPRWAMAFTFGAFLLLAVGTGMAQNSLPGSTLYPVKIASEEVQKATKLDPLASANFAASLAERRVDEVSRLAELSLEGENKDELAGLMAHLENYKKDIEEARTSGDEEVIEQKVAEVTERTKTLNELIKTSAEPGSREGREITARINSDIEEALEKCSDEALVEQIKELVEEGYPALIEARFLASACEPADTEDEGTEEATTTPSDSGTTTEEESTGTTTEE